MIINRIWEMPNSNTFDIRCIKELIERYNNASLISIDPFANKNRIAAECNDLDPKHGCRHNMDAIDFLDIFKDNSVDLVLFDPPYSPRQVSECYKKLGKTVNMQTTQASFWSNLKNKIQKIVKPEGYCISFAWNSMGIGKKRGFEIKEILLVAHGGNHNDTIVTVEQKIK